MLAFVSPAGLSLPSFVSSSSSAQFIYQRDREHCMAINTGVVNPLNAFTHTHTLLFAEHALFGNSVRVKIADKQLSVPMCTLLAWHSCLDCFQ